MEQVVTLRIILEKPTIGVDFGLQKGRGNDYETVQKQRSSDEDLVFEFDVTVKEVKGKEPVFLGPFTQGPPAERFVYLDIGKLAGQSDSQWQRRLKIPLSGITSDMVRQIQPGAEMRLETSVAGKGKDGGPNCATVKPFSGWKLKTTR